VTGSGNEFLVTDTAGGTQDVLSNVERLFFASGNAVALDIGDHQIGGEAFRLYQARLIARRIWVVWASGSVRWKMVTA
jgi:hypothetical protein